MNETKKINFIDLAFNFVPVKIAFFMPIFFLPFTSEFFEFNKLALLTVTTVALLILWMVKMLQEKRVFFTKSVMDVGNIVLLVSFIISSMFSLHKVSSVFGSYGRWFPSLFGVIILFAFYYVLTANITSTKTVKNVLLGFVAGATVSTVVGLFSYFGIKLSSAAYFQVTNFNLTGSSVTTAVMAALAFVFSLIMLLSTKQPSVKIFLSQVMIINLAGALLLGSMPSWVVLGVGLIAAGFFLPWETLKVSKTGLIPLAGMIAALAIVMILPTTRAVVVNSNYPREISLSMQESQIISFSVLRDYPIVGSGPSTFFLNFPVYRTLTLNATNLWNVRFDKPQSEVFNVISSMGMLGIVAVALFGLKAAKLALHGKLMKDEDNLMAMIGTGVISLLALLFFTYITVLTAFLLVLFLALGVSLASLRGEKKVADHVYLGVTSFSANSPMSILGELGDKKELLPYIVSVPMVGMILFGMFQFYRMYAGEVYIRQAIAAAAANNGTLTYEMQGKAINVNPVRDAYHNAYAQTNIALAISLASKEDLSDQEKEMIQTLVAQAIRSSRVATELLNPLSVSNWETRAFIYRALVGVAQDADQWAVQAYNNAIQLDPANPRLRLDLGGLYFAQEDYLSAANLFRQATSLKNDYANAHYNLAHSLMKLNAFADAYREFEAVQRYIDADSEDFSKLSEDLKLAKEKADEVGALSQPTVADLESTGQPAQQTGTEVKDAQEPLVKPGEEEKVRTIPGTTGPSVEGTTDTQNNTSTETETGTSPTTGTDN